MKNKTTLPEVKAITAFTELPVFYIMFPDDLVASVARLEKIEEKLLKRGRRVIHPYGVYRMVHKGRAFLAFELEKV